MAVIATFGPLVTEAAARSINGFIGGSAGVNTGGLFTQPRDVAVYTANTPDTSDDKIFVVEVTPNARVHRLDGNGNFERMWGRDTIRAGASGNTGTNFEVCTDALSGAGGCKSALAGSEAGELSNPTGVAVDQSTGHVYVMDSGNRRVQEFTLDGSFQRAWGWGVDTGANSFEICTVSCQAGSTAGSGAQAGQFAATPNANSIVISPVAPNDIFVTDGGNQRILQFESNGAFRRGWGFDVSDAAPDSAAFEVCDTGDCRAGQTSVAPVNGQFAGGWPRHVAIDSGGVVYASDAVGDNRIVRFDSEPPPPSPPNAAGALLDPLPSPGLLAEGRTSGIEIDPSSDNLFVVRDRSNPFVFLLATLQEIADPSAPLPPGGPPNPSATTDVIIGEADATGGETVSNIGIDPSNGNVYLAAPDLRTTSSPDGKFTGCTSSNNTCHGLLALAANAGPVESDLTAPSDVGATTAMLEGSVSLGGGVAQYRFQVSRDGASWTDASEPRYVAGAGSAEVSATVKGLEPATLYRVRLVVTKQTGIASTETVSSNEDVFLTDGAVAEVTTLGSAERTSFGATLRGLVDPQGTSTNYRFEYGPAGGSFDHHIPIPDAPAGSGNSPLLVIQRVTGLQPETSYHYRIVGTNALGTSVGNAVTFTTAVAAPPPPPPPGRAYELVSPAEKLSGVGVGIWYSGPASNGLIGQAAHVGERFAIRGTHGAVLLDSKYSFANDWALSERTPQGWVSKPVASRRAYGSQTLTFLGLAAATPDMELMGFSNTGLKLFAEQEEWIKENAGTLTYFRDWAQGKWELFGPVEEAQGGGLGATLEIAEDGRSAVASSTTRGLAGPGDPTADLNGSVNSVFLDELPAGPSDAYPGSGIRSVVSMCTPGTVIPARVDVGGSFEQGSQPCPDPAPARDGTLIGGTRGATLGADREGVISQDGSRIFFLSPDLGSAAASCSGVDEATECPTQLYVRQRNPNSSVVTRWISRSEIEDQDASLMGPVIFEGASADGDKVFFRTASPLTADDRNGEGQPPPPGGVTVGNPSQDSWDLFMYDLPDGLGADPAGGDLTRISAGPDGNGDCNSPFQGSSDGGALRFVSRNGSRLYFTCTAPLPGVALPGNGTMTAAGGTPSTSNASNLYLYDASEPTADRWRFIARLPRTSVLGGCATTGVRSGVPLGPNNDSDSQVHVFGSVNCMHGISDGSLVTFWTDGALTGDDPDSVTGDVYAYDLARDDLTRISRLQGGVGGSYDCAPGGSSAQCYGDGGIGPPVGGMSLPKLGVADAGDGRKVVFFASRSRLVPEDVNTAYDVYRWVDGDLSLISPGTPQSGDAFYSGNDATGKNIYFSTRDRLTWQDKDSVLDIYTARIGSGIPQPKETDETCNPVAGQCQEAGGSSQGPPIDSAKPADGSLTAPQRLNLSIARPSSKALRKAARTGQLGVAVAVTRPTTLTVVAKAQFAGKLRRIAGATRRVERAGRATITLSLSRAALRRIRVRGLLVCRVTVDAPGARAATSRLVLRRRPSR